MRSRQGTQLDLWMSKVEASGIQELQSFANGLERDKEAVLAGLTLIKRMMFGQAGFVPFYASACFMLCSEKEPTIWDKLARQQRHR
ncbi:hypothetical protein KSF_000940 [Reticulibacter mediterranei]|uniref:Uncharacterized protein n=1 Tax=Reticulibacter mediterranei TaxID=2778369 RepID=A0A8J3IGW1_9CHLR|nr:hypothetical protein KSF_000940 [Reticulibacter mediterranei]